jgi:spore maturation protein CgeB
MNIVYSFNKKGFEAEYWQKEIGNASGGPDTFIPFNHDPYLNTDLYVRAQLLDNLYYEQNPDLLRMYSDFEDTIKKHQAEAVIVDNCNPYHPDYLKHISIYKALRIADGPISAYDRDFAYLHAFDHVLYHSPACSRDMEMAEKLLYCGAKTIDFWPLGSFDALCDPSKTDRDILSGERDIDVIFVGALHLNKMPMLAKVKKALGRRFRLYGLTTLKRNVYFNVKYGLPGWVRPVDFTDYVPLYQRSKIGINVHNRGDYTVGSYRLFDLPANGIMQISDGGQHLEHFFSVGEEIVSYRNAEDLIDKMIYYLAHAEERKRIALNGFLRVKKDYKIAHLLRKAGEIIRKGMEQRDGK